MGDRGRENRVFTLVGLRELHAVVRPRLGPSGVRLRHRRWPAQSGMLLGGRMGRVCARKQACGEAVAVAKSAAAKRVTAAKSANLAAGRIAILMAALFSRVSRLAQQARAEAAVIVYPSADKRGANLAERRRAMRYPQSVVWPRLARRCKCWLV